MTKIGDPVVAIRRAATERDVDVIVVGSHDKNFLRRIVSPSVSRELAHKANRPVLIVP
ncbi:MAG: universal stress protein [Actinobacteria bacterium]|nr:MAG: universal stress protein [Actinomycetota bacterium]